MTSRSEPWTETTKRKDGVGVVVGRFHVPKLTNGHKDLVVVAQQHRIFCAVIGCSPVPSRRNPLPFECRQQLIHEEYPDAVIVPHMDRESDHEWSFELDRMLRAIFPGEKIVLYGGRDSFLTRYHGRLKTSKVPHWNESGPSGSDIRDQLRVEQSAAFRAGLIYGRSKPGFGQVFSTVDIVALDVTQSEKPKVVVIQKPLDARMCFPGGFVDPKDESYLAAAVREFREECNAGLTSVTCISPAGVPIPDWRYRDTGGQIMTMVYSGLLDGEVSAGDDVAGGSVHLLDPTELHKIVDYHQPIVKLVLDELRRRSLT